MKVNPHSRTLMHEIGHGCGLTDMTDPQFEDNLMYEYFGEDRRKVIGTPMMSQASFFENGNSRWIP